MLFHGAHEMDERRHHWKKGKQHANVKSNTNFDDYGFDDEDDHEHRRPLRYTDLRVDERRLGLSVKTGGATLLLQKSDGKSYAMTVLDTPRHMNFRDEVTSSLTVADGVVVMVDVAEGLTMGTRAVFKEVALLGLSIVCVLSKLDRVTQALSHLQLVNSYSHTHQPPAKPLRRDASSSSNSSTNVSAE